MTGALGVSGRKDDLDDYRAEIPDSRPVIPEKEGIRKVADANDEPKAAANAMRRRCLAAVRR